MKSPFHDTVVGQVAEDVLSAQQHLELGVGHMRLYLAQSLPRVLVEKAQAHVKGRAAPALDGIEARLVHCLKYRLKLVVGKPRCHQRLVCVSKYCFGELYFLPTIS